MIRMVIVNAIACGVVGYVLGNAGFHFTSWQYWIVMICCLVIMANSILR